MRNIVTSVMGFSTLCFAKAGNLVHPGSFASGTWGPWQNILDATIGVVSPGFTGKFAGTHTVTETSPEVYLIYPTFEVTEGQPYKWSLDYKLKNPNCFTFVIANEGLVMTLGSEGPDSTPVPHNQWHRYSANFLAASNSDNAGLQTRCQANATLEDVTAEFDNIQITPFGNIVYNLKSPAAGPNVVMDPKFESGTLDAYNLSITPESTARVIKHRRSHILRLNTDAANEFASISVGQKVLQTSSKTIYRLAVDIKLIRPYPPKCTAQLVASKGSLSTSRTLLNGDGGPQPPVGRWFTVGGVVYGYDGETTISFGFDCEVGGVIYDIKNIQFVPLN